ncbi:putative 3-oxo-5-alpha-steroid 4-dehydrogenase [Lyophyllum shimeji]|uniref:3-oxo-5-alpha-steroid 4-dehydrogenase n=1 Tax=Lyophyllum shimeji TaxID=47721 RepID=A0A9P3PMQ6_LYOSH|nr:putative 3-oxo-5-alpha-steroid 4-dehydrogenase [Lyophyllum shimeji]
MPSVHVEQASYLYHAARKYFTLGSVATFPVLFFVNAPFGRFTPSSDSIFLVDGIKSWIFMELVSPLCFLLTFLASPLSPPSTPSPPLNFTSPQSLLALLYLTHYANRALISPLRTPSRSKSHLIVPLSAVFFNTVNGALMGSYLSSPFARAFLGPSLPSPTARPSFYLGLLIWAAGFAGNIYHDEILLNIRRKAIKGKGKATSPPSSSSSSSSSAAGKTKGEHYAIPTGALYAYVSYPNYLCEWIEWTGFALASSPVPSLSLSSLLSLLSPQEIMTSLKTPPEAFAPSLTPPWIFLLAEVLLMLPRAVRGHRWYHDRFGSAYPRERRAVVPFLL